VNVTVTALFMGALIVKNENVSRLETFLKNVKEKDLKMCL